MEWTQFTIFFITVFGMFIWVRAESRADIRHMDAKIDAMRELTHSIHMEIKDFHNKLFELEKSKKDNHSYFNNRMTSSSEVCGKDS